MSNVYHLITFDHEVYDLSTYIWVEETFAYYGEFIVYCNTNGYHCGCDASS